MSNEEFTHCSAVDGEVCGLELDLISVGLRNTSLMAFEGSVFEG